MTNPLTFCQRTDILSGDKVNETPWVKWRSVIKASLTQPSRITRKLIIDILHLKRYKAAASLVIAVLAFFTASGLIPTRS